MIINLNLYVAILNLNTTSKHTNTCTFLRITLMRVNVRYVLRNK